MKLVYTLNERRLRLKFFIFIASIFLFAFDSQSQNEQNLARANELLQRANIILKTEPEKGIVWLKEAQFIFKNQGKVDSEIDCILSLAEIHLRLSDYEISYSLLTNAASMSLEHNLPHQHLMSLGSLGRVSTYMDEVERSISFFNEGIDLAKQYGYKNEILYFTAISAYTKINQKKDFSLKNYSDIYNSFLSFDKKSKDTLMLMPIYNFYAGALFNIKNDLTSAIYYYKKCMLLAELTNDKYRYCLYSNNYGDALRKSGEIQKAKEIFQESLTKGTQINSKLLIYNGHKNLSICYEDLSDFKLALSHYKEYQSVRNAVVNENLLRKTSQIHTLYQLEKKARENDKIRNEQNIGRAEAETKIKSYQIFSFLVFIILVFFLILFYINRTRLNESISQASVINEQNLKLQILNNDLWNQRKTAEEAKSEAEMAIKSKIDFFSIITHEIRTPLNAVIGTVELLGEEDPMAHQKKSLEILKFSSESLLNLVNDILDFNKIEAQKVELEKKQFSLKKLLINIKNSLQMKADEKGLDLRLKLDKNLPEIFIGDSQRLGQIFYNLGSNALKFTESGYVEIEIRYYSNKEPYNLYISVKDTGIGIPIEKQKGVFDFFSQADSSIGRKFGGSGLGLTITKNLLQLMGTTIQLESAEYLGSRFYFSLALPVDPAMTEKDLLETVNLKMGENLSGNILFVEDVEFNRVVAERFFKKWGLDFETAENGHQAIEMAQNRSYDLILMDLQLPDMNGFKISENIRKIPHHFQTPILAMTASSFAEVKDQLVTAKMNGYIPKPFIAIEFKQILWKWLSQKGINA